MSEFFTELTREFRRPNRHGYAAPVWRRVAPIPPWLTEEQIDRVCSYIQAQKGSILSTTALESYCGDCDGSDR